MPQSQHPGSSLRVAEAVAENAGAVAEVSGPALEGAVANDGREDLTVFFAIGLVVDVLLVTAFLVWAVRQWRKKK